MNTPNSERKKSARHEDTTPTVRDILELRSTNPRMGHSLLHTSEAAKILGVSGAWLARHRWAGTGIPYIRVGKRAVRYRFEDLQTWIAQGVVSPNEGGHHE